MTFGQTVLAIAAGVIVAGVGLAVLGKLMGAL
jgi:hypothetical protein